MSPSLPKLSDRRPDSQQLIRQWALLRLLAHATEPYSVKHLAEQLQTSKATIERDLATLESNFALIEEQVGKQKKVYRLDQTLKERESLTFGVTELLAIYAAHAALVGITGTPIHDDLVTVPTKIRGLLSKRHNGGLEAMVRVFAPNPRGIIDYAAQTDVIDDLVDAIARRRQCQLTYRAAGKEADRTHRARPLRLVWHRSALYLLACLGDHERITTLAVQRIRELATTPSLRRDPRRRSTATSCRCECGTMRGGGMIGSLFDGPLDVVGDVHGELAVLRTLLRNLGYDESGDHPDRRRLVFLGDLCDRGPDSPGVIELVRALVERGKAQCILGNHELNLLRGDRKHGNSWFFEPDDEYPDREFEHCRTATPAQSEEFRAFFLSLPIALEHRDLRIVHASWHAESIEHLRTSRQTSLELYAAREDEAHAYLKTSNVLDDADAEKLQYTRELKDPDANVPLLRNIGLVDEQMQMRNPIRVLTSGPERVANTPFFASGKWRMCDRVLWWNEYADDIPVIVGHYWRVADQANDELARWLSGGKPNLFQDEPPHTWVGRKRNVFCVDFSIGGRYRELAEGKTEVFGTRLAAVRWPDRVLMFDDGSAIEMAPPSPRER